MDKEVVRNLGCQKWRAERGKPKWGAESGKPKFVGWDETGVKNGTDEVPELTGSRHGKNLELETDSRTAKMVSYSVSASFAEYSDSLRNPLRSRKWADQS